MNRFVVISDTHVHPFSAFAKGDGLKNSRLLRTLTVLDDSLRKAQEEGIPWLLPGDLIHTAGYALNIVLSGVTQILGKYPEVPKVTVWGNHDARGIGGLISLDQTIFASLLRAVPNLYVLDPSAAYADPVDIWTRDLPKSRPYQAVTWNGLEIRGAGYQPRGDLLDLGPGGDIGLFHQTVRGSFTAHDYQLDEGIEGDALLDLYRISLVGHVHHPQQIDAPKGKAILIPGSPEHHNFGDRDDHGWWILGVPDDPTENPEVEFIPGGSPKFLTVDSPDEIEDDGNFYRVRSVPKGTILPEDSTAIAPQPTTVEERDLLRDVTEVEQILQVWVRENPPEEGDPGRYVETGRLLLEAQDPARLRPVRTESLHLHNFCSFADQELQVREGLWLVIGRGRDYPSNGAGKSTLVGEALYWLIFGKNTKGLAADEVIRRGTSQCSVSGTFRDDQGSVYEITRKKGSGVSELHVTQDGEPWEASGVNEMTAKLSQYFGLTPEIYQALGYFSQEKVLLFSSATDGERKNVVADLIGLSAYQEASSAAAEQVTKFSWQQQEKLAAVRVEEKHQEEAREDLKNLQATSKTWEAEQEAKRVEWQNRLQKLKESGAIPQAKAKRDRILKRQEGARNRYRERVESEHPERVARIQAELTQTLQHRIETLRVKQEQVEAPLIDRFESLPRARAMLEPLDGLRVQRDEMVEEVQGLRDQRSELRSQKERIVGEISGYERSLDSLAEERKETERALAEGICPTCGQKITDAHRHSCLSDIDEKREKIIRSRTEAEKAVIKKTQEIEDANIRIREVEVRQEKLDQMIAHLEEIRDAIRSRSQLDDDIDALETQISDLAEKAEEQAQVQTSQLLASHSKRQEDRAKRMARYIERLEEEHRAQVEKAERELLFVDETRNPYKESMTKTEDRIARIERTIEGAQEEVEKLGEQIQMYEYWKGGFSKRGIQSLLVEELATLFNQNRGEILPVLTQGVYDVQFSTLSRTKAGEIRERTEFVIYEHGEEIPYGSLSGGQRRRIDVGIMLILVHSVSQWMGVPGILGILTLDEVFGFLDSSGAEGLLDALEQVRQQIPTIYAVTHDTHLQSLFPEVIQVEQDDQGISRVA